jgi:hypothetical protein
MTSGSTPPPGWGPSPAFGRPLHSGIHLVPARTRPHPGLYNGPSIGGTHVSWVWIALAAAAILVLAFAATRYLRRP